MNYKWIDKDTVYDEVKKFKGDYFEYLKKQLKNRFI